MEKEIVWTRDFDIEGYQRPMTLNLLQSQDEVIVEVIIPALPDQGRTLDPKIWRYKNATVFGLELTAFWGAYIIDNGGKHPSRGASRAVEFTNDREEDIKNIKKLLKNTLLEIKHEVIPAPKTIQAAELQDLAVSVYQEVFMESTDNES